MNRKMKKTKDRVDIHPVFFLFFGLSIAVSLTGILAALAICIDRCDELFNVLRYQDDWRVAHTSIYKNKWQPFSGNFFEDLIGIPHELYVGFAQFSSAAFIALILFPLLVFVVPVYDAWAAMNFDLLILGWAPFIAGILLFIIVGIICEKTRVDRTYKKNIDDFDPR